MGKLTKEEVVSTLKELNARLAEIETELKEMKDKDAKFLALVARQDEITEQIKSLEDFVEEGGKGGGKDDDSDGDWLL